MSTPDKPRKRKQCASESASESGADPANLTKRTCDLDLDILECPVCSEPFSLTVFQCQNGHPVCSDCCKILSGKCPSCKKTVGTIRCIAIEKVVAALQVNCKYAPHGCKEMLQLSDREEHEEECEFVPDLQCPVPCCEQLGTKLTLPKHLKMDHNIRTVELNEISRTVGIRMEASERLVMVGGVCGGVCEEMFLVHRDDMDTVDLGGQIFFCTSFGTNFRNYELKVSLSYPSPLSYSMADRMPCIRNLEDLKKEQGVLFFPSQRYGIPIGHVLHILLGVFPVQII